MKELETLGLTSREVECYLALLRLGSSTAGDMVRESGIPSSKIYEVLDKLIKQGLVNFIVKGKTKHFSASEPEVLLEMAEEKKELIKRIIPELKSKQNSVKKEEVVMYEGFEGLKTALRKVLRVLKKGEEYFVYISPHENLNSEPSKFFYNSFNLQRQEAGIITKLLININQKEIMKKEYLQTLKRKDVRFTSFRFPSRIGVFKNHVLIVSEGRGISTILIHSEDIYKKYKDFFLYLWKQAKR